MTDYEKRELRAKVALAHGDFTYRPYTGATDECEAVVVFDRGGERMGIFDWPLHPDSLAKLGIPDFPNDIAAAWTLVEELIRLGYEVIVGNNYDGSWECECNDIDHDNPKMQSVLGQGETATVAICLAYLAAKGVT